MTKGKMLILPGNSGDYDDESGNSHTYADGALHEKAAEEFAKIRDYTAEVLWVKADSGGKQTTEALKKLNSTAYSASESPSFALYGFSGGGYTLRRILDKLKQDQLERLKLVVVLGAPPTRWDGKHFVTCETDKNFRLAKSEDPKKCHTFKSDYDATNFAGRNTNI
jgi:hypothetical protein